MDATGSAGLDVLRDVGQNGPTTTVQYAAADLPKTIPRVHGRPHRASRHPGLGVLEHRRARQLHHRGGQDRGRQSVMQVQLNLTYPNDPDLTATLYHYEPAPARSSAR